MELFTLLALIAVAAFILKSRDQKRRIALLGSYLSKFQIENLMESVTDGYLRALGEDNPERKAQIWSMLDTAEITLCEQFNRFVAEFAKVDAEQARVSKLAVAVPYAELLFPHATFDLRKALSIHAQGLNHAANNTRGQSQKDKAFTMTAELFLMQYTCHWYCRSKAVASARMMARHKTPFAQLLASVAPDTRKAYSALIAGVDNGGA
jgi:hypothetical protein